MEKQFYAVEATLENGNKLLCWQDKKHLIFAEKLKGFDSPHPPTLFNTRQAAANAKVLSITTPVNKTTLNKFNEYVEAKNSKVVKVKISY